MFPLARLLSYVLAVGVLQTSTTSAADVSTTESRLPKLARAESANLRPPSIGTPENPFENTCDGRSIGFFGPSGEPPRMSLGGAPAGSVYECRTDHITSIESQAFAPCDGRDGTSPSHTPELKREGSYRTEVRYRTDGRASETASVHYYVHHSLDGVACCRSDHSDSEWFEAALKHIQPAEPFDEETNTRNPFIKLVGLNRDEVYPVEVLSLRRTFRFNPGQTLVLIRRTMISRHTFKKTGEQVCNGVTLYVPRYGIPQSQHYSCYGTYKKSPFGGGVLDVDASCPDVYCTVTTCEEYADGCTRVTHTFYRGPGQDPWVVNMPTQCPPHSVTDFENYECDVYVINRRGQAVCLKEERGSIVALRVLREDNIPLGLRLLRGFRASFAGDRYVFSAKSRSKKAEKRGVLHLPD